MDELELVLRSQGQVTATRQSQCRPFVTFPQNPTREELLEMIREVLLDKTPLARSFSNHVVAGG